MFRNLFIAKRSPIAILNVPQLRTRQLILTFSSASSGGKSEKGGDVSSKPEKKVDLWQKIKSGMENPLQSQARPKSDQRGTSPGNRQGQNQNQRKNNSNNIDRREQAGGNNNDSTRKPTGRPQNRERSPAPNVSNSQRPYVQQTSRKPRSRSPPSRDRPANVTGTSSTLSPSATISARKPGGFRPRRFPDNRSATGSDARSTFTQQRRSRGGVNETEQGSAVEKERREVDIADADAALLFDDDFFVDKVRKDGGRWVVHDEDADFIDNLLSRAYLESIQTSDHSFLELYHSRGYNSRFHLPKARSLHQLRCALEPKINADPNSDGYKYAAQAWTVLQRNNYYSDRQKRQIVNGIANMVNDVIVQSNNPDLEPLDEAIDPDFYLGPDDLKEGFEEDLEEGEGETYYAPSPSKADADAKQNFPVEEEWDNDAVVDEDELEALAAGKK